MLREEKKLSLDGNSIVYVIEDKKVIGLIGVKDIIRDNAKDVINKLTDEMLQHAANMEFEKAAELRDKIKELESSL